MSTKGPFAGDNIYAAKVVKAQTKAAKVKKGKSVSLAVKIQNDSSASDTLKVRGITSGATGFNVRYFHGAKDITTLVYLGKYSTGALAPGQNHYITVRFAAQSTAKYLTVRSMNEPTARDVVRVRAARV
jgi:hypothetical protein